MENSYMIIIMQPYLLIFKPCLGDLQVSGSKRCVCYLALHIFQYERSGDLKHLTNMRFSNICHLLGSLEPVWLLDYRQRLDRSVTVSEVSSRLYDIYDSNDHVTVSNQLLFIYSNQYILPPKSHSPCSIITSLALKNRSIQWFAYTA